MSLFIPKIKNSILYILINGFLTKNNELFRIEITKKKKIFILTICKMNIIFNK